MLRQRGIGSRTHLREQGCFVLRSDATMASRSGPGGHRAGLALLGAPALDRTDANAEEAGRLGLREPGVNGSQQPLAEVGGVLLHAGIVAPAQLLRNPL